MIIQTPMVTFHHLYFLFILCLFLAILIDATQNNIKCIGKEKKALLQFKRGIQTDHCGLLSSWEGSRGCCQWHGVQCSNLTGHVLGITLSGAEANNHKHPCLEGKLSASLLKLKHLEHLDLSFNYFQSQTIPDFIGSFANLKHLNLSNSGFVGKIPQSFGNIPNLSYLDLSQNKIEIESFQWLFNLTSLSIINLNNIELSQVRDWFYILNNLPFLRVIKMDWCNLPPPSSIIHKNSSSPILNYLSLAHNNFGDPSVFHWLFNLNGIDTHLAHLDLSYNSIPGLIPSDLSTLHSLVYLDLSSNAFEGHIPNYFGNMSSLSYLSLFSNAFEGHIPNYFGNMPSLSHIDLSANALNGSISGCFRETHSLSYLDVSGNELEGRIPEIISNLKQLIHLDLSYNNFRGIVPSTLGGLCSLQYLELSNNNLTGELPVVIENLSLCSDKSLRFLNLENNNFWGSIPDKIGDFSSLRVLYLDGNELNGTISPRIGKLSMLENLQLGSNSLTGTLFASHFADLSRLRNLDMSNNPELVVNISVNWVPPFQLDTIYMSSCKLGPEFPKWLQTQTRISWIDISISGISDTVPASFWNSLSSNLEYLNLSRNNIHGVIPSDLSITLGELPEIDLSSNSFEGAIPSFLGNISSLSLNDNRFSNPIPFLCPKTKVILSVLDLSNNLFSGELPDCWMYFDQLSILRLENNGFSGKLPPSIGSLERLQALHMRNNSFSGQLPMSLQNCTSLVLFDASYNSLNGEIPSRIGYNLGKIGVLSLRRNYFSGILPFSLCHLLHLQILDLSLNQFSGDIPGCMSNFTAMKTTSDQLPDILYQYDFSVIVRYYDAAFVMWKGKDRIFKNSLGQVKFIHMSDNNLAGEIPVGISLLIGLISLDLSNNKLTGRITPIIGQLKALELLDLSKNYLSGEIPATLADLNFLGLLNLSYNNLSGRIPTGTLLQGFDGSTYMGNPELCGPPLGKCPGDQPRGEAPRGDYVTPRGMENSDDIFPGLYISMVIGFIIGFWGVFGTLVIKRSWRHAFFRSR